MTASGGEMHPVDAEFAQASFVWVWDNIDEERGERDHRRLYSITAPEIVTALNTSMGILAVPLAEDPA